MITVPIADMLSQVRNGYRAQKRKVILPHSRLKEAVGKVLVKEGYLKEIKTKESDKEKKTHKMLELILLYHGKEASVTGIKSVSKPGLRVYRDRKNLGWVRSGLGISIISTPLGLMTDKEAKYKKLGGEVICKVW